MQQDAGCRGKADIPEQTLTPFRPNPRLTGPRRDHGDVSQWEHGRLYWIESPPSAGGSLIVTDDDQTCIHDLGRTPTALRASVPTAHPAPISDSPLFLARNNVTDSVCGVETILGGNTRGCPTVVSEQRHVVHRYYTRHGGL